MPKGRKRHWNKFSAALSVDNSLTRTPGDGESRHRNMNRGKRTKEEPEWDEEAPFRTGFTAYVTNGGWNMMESILSILILENSTRTYLLEYDDEEKPDPHYGHELIVKKDDAGSQTRVFYELNELREDRKEQAAKEMAIEWQRSYEDKVHAAFMSSLNATKLDNMALSIRGQYTLYYADNECMVFSTNAICEILSLP
ncbi:hypothetical protein N7533_008538 [Penicillium manginii]|uniref:uncharacterized protein n=1 Tax=Penicillium manginii TaxID=203109 RepID=UPI002549AF5F|nr:uncharacterized protein N7533_008538 [Penicillium manginii]KAJ5743668.1 hypothetical protein N7533_008538 [Penicillium manginii]